MALADYNESKYYRFVGRAQVARRRSDETRGKILKVTLDLLQGRDFMQVTTREIAEAAGVAETTLFRYFPRKDDILSTIIDELAADFFARFEGVLEVISNPVERLRALARISSGFGYERRAVVRVLEREMTFDRDTSRALRAQQRRYLDAVEAIVSAGVEAGLLRPEVDPRVAAMAFHSSCSAVLEEEWLFDFEHPDAEAFQARADAYLDQLLGGLLKPGSGP